MVEEKGDEELYKKLDVAYASSDEETEEEDDAFPETHAEGEEGEVSERDDEDWESDESETGFGDDCVPHVEILQTKSKVSLQHQKY